MEKPRINRRLLRRQAQTLLANFLQTVWYYNHPGRARHFRAEFRQIWVRQESMGFLKPPPEQIPGSDPEYKDLQDNVRYNDNFYDVLEAIAKQEIPSEKAFRMLSHALNRTIDTIGFHPERLAPTGDGPYMPTALDAIRAGGELLLRYLNITYRCGVVHALCEICGCLMTRGRGKKKVCSQECREKKWGYANRKEYFLEYRKKPRVRRRNPRKKFGKAGEN